jgi:hypothetical protein
MDSEAERREKEINRVLDLKYSELQPSDLDLIDSISAVEWDRELSR